MLGRLDANVSAAFHDREGVRLEVDIPIWLVKKAPGECPVDDDVVVDIVPVTGKLLDLSEGGAAVSADMPLVAGDLLEFWSADSQIWLPPTKAGVVSLEEEEGDDHVHLHFLDPPLTEIRKAILEIRRLEWEEVEVPADPGEVSAS
jgi:hypothetical protein